MILNELCRKYKNVEMAINEAKNILERCTYIYKKTIKNMEF